MCGIIDVIKIMSNKKMNYIICNEEIKRKRCNAKRVVQGKKLVQDFYFLLTFIKIGSLTDLQTGRETGKHKDIQRERRTNGYTNRRTDKEKDR